MLTGSIEILESSMYCFQSRQQRERETNVVKEKYVDKCGG